MSNQHHCGLAIVSTPNTGNKNLQEYTYKSSNSNNQTGAYQLVTAREKYSSADIVRGGKPAHKSEFKTSATVKQEYGEGYVEYQKTERFTEVVYTEGKSSYNNSGCIGYVNGSSLTFPNSSGSSSGSGYKSFGGGYKCHTGGYKRHKN